MSFYNHTTPRKSAVASLPQAAGLKLARMEEEVQTLNARSVVAHEKVLEAVGVRSSVEQELWRIERADSGGMVDRKVVAKLKASIAEQQSAVAEAQRRYDAMSELKKTLADPYVRVKGWVEDNSGKTFAAVEPPKIKRSAAMSWPAFVDLIRARIAALKMEFASVEKAPLPSSVAKAAIEVQVDELASAGRPDVTAVMAGGPILWAGQKLYGGEHEFDPRAILAWFDRGALLRRLNAEVDAIADDSSALDGEQRAKELQRIGSELLQAEREEEAAIDAAAIEFAVIARRLDADPRAVLGLATNVPGYSD